MTQVPVIDLNAVDAKALKEIDAACRDHGFFLIKNHGLDAETAVMWKESASFFSSPYEIKASVMRSEDYPIGYYDRELTKRVRDQKEVFDYFVEPEGMDAFVRWPEESDTFREAMQAYHEANTNLAILSAYRLVKLWGGRLNLISVVASGGDHSQVHRYLRSLRDLCRIPTAAETVVLDGPFEDALTRAPRGDIDLFGLQKEPDLAFVRKTMEVRGSSCLFLSDSGQESAFA